MDKQLGHCLADARVVLIGRLTVTVLRHGPLVLLRSLAIHHDR
jgi:hypothetical protein